MSTAQLRVVIEKYPEGYVAYLLGMKGIVVGEGDSYQEALEDVKSAIKLHIETFGEDGFEPEEVMETFVTKVVL
ncbi:MAG: type II toxin-antitoxin system HicB family antitoxin [Theionarchaea archaeon]|nr:type II toxin-antitoxin system HicB family antitoxin [Theionarchaea archaeon]